MKKEIKQMSEQNRIKVFLLNGPPNTGKDTLANNVINKDNSFVKGSFSYPMKEAVKAFYGLSDNAQQAFETDRSLKESPHNVFLGQSYRDACISFAEEYVKPKLGHDTFGKLFVGRVKRQIQLPKKGNLHILVPDSGFTEEAQPLIDEYGADNVFVIKIARKDCDYSDDSRGYIDAEKLGIREFFITNSNLDRFQKQSLELVQLIKNNRFPKTEPFETHKIEKGPKAGKTKKTSSSTKKKTAAA